MPKHPTSLRLDPEVKRDLLAYAKASGRTLTNLMVHILREWLKYQKSNGWQARKK